MFRRASFAMIVAVAMLMLLPVLASAYADQVPLSSLPADLGSPMPPLGISIKFEGVISSTTVPDDPTQPQIWEIQVWGLDVPVTVLVPSTAEIDTQHGDPVPGAWVEVKAHLEPTGDPTSFNIVADKIEVKRSPDACFKVEFYGELTDVYTDTQTNETVWIVTTHEGNEHHVIITDQTQIQGDPVVGSIVKVEGCAESEDRIVAREVRVLRHPGEGGEEVEFRGPIVEITDTQWQVGHWTVIISDTTQITGDPPDVGDMAEVKGVLNELGQVVASQIEVKDRGVVHSYVQIEGYITAVGDTELEIQGIPIQIVTDTVEIGLPPEVGLWARADVIVENAAGPGPLQDGTIYTAVRIRTHRSGKPEDALKFTGIVESMDSDAWVVSGWPFVVPTDARIKHGPVAVGDWVEIEAHVVYDDGTGTWTYTAYEVDVKHKRGGEPAHPDGGVKIEGRITAMDPNTGLWKVEGIPVEVGSQTIIDARHGDPAVGVWVEIKGMAPGTDGPYTALAIKTEDDPNLDPGRLKFEGRLESMDEDWGVAGWSFVVDDTTSIEGTPAVGDRVEVTATWDGEATYHAEIVKARGHHS